MRRARPPRNPRRGWLKLRETRAPARCLRARLHRAPHRRRSSEVSDTTHAAGLNPQAGPDHDLGL